MKKVLVIILLFLVGFNMVCGDSEEVYHLKLLAVQETPTGYNGSDADLYLELKEGSGRVFLETSPLTKLDTQISTRFAKEIACSHFNLNCNQYDFIFTIKSDSNIIGGPSAGAAVAALTTIAVLDLGYDSDITITGTINSGGIVGPVGGVKEKLDAAAQAGLKKVLIATGSSSYPAGENQTINLVEYGSINLSMEVKETVDLDDVILELTGVDLNHKDVLIGEDASYQQIMEGLQFLLCNRTLRIEEEIRERNIFLHENITQELQSKKEAARNASRQGDDYSAASICFGANILLKNYHYKQQNLTPLQLTSLFNVLDRKVTLLQQKLREREMETISDLQTRMVVEERLSDVQEQLRQFEEDKSTESPEHLAGLLAYAEERYFSALSWMQFFSMEGKKFVIDGDKLKESCSKKISESQERVQYASLYIGEENTAGITTKINRAQKALEEGQFELCLITAIQTKAEADAILSSLGLKEENVGPVLESKAKAVQRVIAENSAEGVFPILGYSYYQYGQSLKEREPFTALVYFEYALEMSDLSIYFPEEKTVMELDRFDVPRHWLYGWAGVIIGILLGMGVGYSLRKKKKRRR